MRRRRRHLSVWSRQVIVFADRNAEVTPEQRRARLIDLPPSAKLVYKVLEGDSPLTQSEIADRTRLSKRTTRHALSQLTEERIVDEEVYIPDARKRLYRALPLAESEEPEAEVEG